MRSGKSAENTARGHLVLDTADDGMVAVDEQGVIYCFNEARADGSRGAGKRFVLEGLHKDGTVVPIELTIGDAFLSGRPLLCGIIRDISKRWQAEEALRKSRAFLQTVIDEIPESLMVIDRNYGVVLANRTVREMIGGKDPVASGLACHQISHRCEAPCEGDTHVCPLGEVLSTKAPVSVTHTHFDADGNEVLMEIIAAPVFDESGEVKQIIESSRNVTARVQAEEATRLRQEEMARLTKLGTIGAMAAGLAHELNQPLSAIVNYTQACLERLQADGEKKEDLREDLEQVAAQAARAGDIVEHTRDLVRKGELERATCDLNELVRSTAELCAAELQRNTVELDLLLSDPLPRVNVVPIQIEQVVVNLIQNGVDSMVDEPGGPRTLTVQTESGENGWVQLTVRDTGVGLPPGSPDELFDPFFTTKSNGMGMGLSISRSIIESHGGRLWGVSNADHGATFGFTIPVAGGEDRNDS